MIQTPAQESEHLQKKNLLLKPQRPFNEICSHLGEK